MLKFFRLPFATAGDKVAVPDAADVDGNVSYSQGYGFDYQRQKTDPAAKNIERDKMNQLFFDVTTALAELQSQGIPDFITSALNGGAAYPYAKNALVRHAGVIYISTSDANTAAPTDATKWVVFSGTGQKTVRNYGAALDGVTSDNAACQAMLADTGGVLIFPEGESNIEDLVITGYDHVRILGAGRPAPDATKSTLRGGSVLIGRVTIQSNDVACRNFGVDSGVGRTVVNRGGLWADANTSQIGILADVQNVSVLNESDAGTWHGVTVQGYDRNVISQIHAIRQQFGVVIKGRNFTVSDILVDECRTAGVYPKSDLPAFAGGVADGTVTNGEIANVVSTPLAANITCAGVYCHASTAGISKINISNVHQNYGLTPVLIAGGGAISDPAIQGITASNIGSDRAQYGAQTIGYNYDTKLSGITANNPATGRAVILAGSSYGWAIGDFSSVITDAAITADILAEFYGMGVWDNATARNAFRTMKVQVAGADLAQIACGKCGYATVISSEANLTGINGAVADATYTPYLNIMPNSVIQLQGRFDLTASTNKFFCNLPINTGKQKIYACGGIDSGGNYVAVAVRLNDFQLSIEPSLPAGFQRIDLSNISIPMM